MSKPSSGSGSGIAGGAGNHKRGRSDESEGQKDSKAEKEQPEKKLRTASEYKTDFSWSEYLNKASNDYLSAVDQEKTFADVFYVVRKQEKLNKRIEELRLEISEEFNLRLVQFFDDMTTRALDIPVLTHPSDEKTMNVVETELLPATTRTSSVRPGQTAVTVRKPMGIRVVTEPRSYDFRVELHPLSGVKFGNPNMWRLVYPRRHGLVSVALKVAEAQSAARLRDRALKEALGRKRIPEPAIRLVFACLFHFDVSGL